MTRMLETLALGGTAAALWLVVAGAQEPLERPSDAPDENVLESTLGYDDYLAGSGLRASELIGATVHNPEGQDLGEVKDLIVSRTGDDVITAVISVGGILNVGDKLVGVPYDDLRISADGEDLYLAATVDELEARPAFEYEPHETVQTREPSSRAKQAAEPSARGGSEAGQETELGETREPVGVPETARSTAQVPTSDAGRETTRREQGRAGRFETESAPAAGAEISPRNRVTPPEAATSPRPEAQPGAVTAENRNVETMDRNAHRATTLIGTTVVGPRGNEVGEIDDLVVSANGRMQAVLSIGGAGALERLVAVPVEELTIHGSATGDSDEAEVSIDKTARELVDTNPEFRYELRAAAIVTPRG